MNEVADFIAAWNEITSRPIVRCLAATPKRDHAIRARLRDRPLDEWREIFARVEASNFCRGIGNRGWVATIDWILRPDTAVKILEGQYDNRANADFGMARRLGPTYSTEEWTCAHEPKCGARAQHAERLRIDAMKRQRGGGQ